MEPEGIVLSEMSKTQITELVRPAGNTMTLKDSVGAS